MNETTVKELMARARELEVKGFGVTIRNGQPVVGGVMNV